MKDFENLLKLQSNYSNEKQIILYIFKELQGIENIQIKVDNIGNLLVEKGNLSPGEYYPCICAHLDTVHEFNENYTVFKGKIKENKELVYFAKDSKTGERLGVGADDKCGVYAVIQAIKIFDKIKAVFFTQEESGCIGSSAVDLNFFNDCGYLIQLDRKNSSDLITTHGGGSTVSDEFRKVISNAIAKFGYKENNGLITDVFELFSRGVGISCINISCGYYLPHTNKEYIVIREFENSLQFLFAIIERLGLNLYEKEYTLPIYHNKYKDNADFDNAKNWILDNELLINMLDYNIKECYQFYLDSLFFNENLIDINEFSTPIKELLINK